MASVIWTSASKVKAWYACARRAFLEKFVETEAMRAGTERHAIVEAHYLGGQPAKPVSPESLEIVAKAVARGLLPPKDQVLSCEASDLPPEYRTVIYDRAMFKVLIGTGDRPWGVRGAADLAIVTPEEPDTLWLVDWKGRSQDDGEIQGSVYALAYATMFPGFKTYRFEQRSLTLSWAHDRYDFPAADLPAVRDFVEKLVYAMTDDKEHAPRENKYCSSCSVNADCSVYQSAVSAPLVESLPAVKTFSLPVDFGELLALKEKASVYEKIAAGLKDRCQDELLRCLEAGPIKAAGQTYSLSSGVSGYAIKDEALLDVDEALRLAGNETLEDFYLPDVPRIREALQRAEKKVVVEADRLAIKSVLANSFEAKRYPKIAKKAG